MRHSHISFNERAARLAKKVMGLVTASLISLTSAPTAHADDASAARANDARPAELAQLTDPAPTNLTTTTADAPLSLSPIIRWSKDTNAVSYELELFSKKPKKVPRDDTSKKAIYRTSDIYANAFNIPIDEIVGENVTRQPLWWRVRAKNLAGEPISPFSELAPLYTNADLPRTDAPVLNEVPDDELGARLLYPVYSWVRPYNAAGFTIELYDTDPDAADDAAPIDTFTSPIAEFYDPSPRLSDEPFYWRVRSTDENGNPIGEWSSVSSFTTSPSEQWDVGVMGDSISHGGGHLSYGPEDLEFSWLHYLDFPAINLSQSGNVTADLVERFERDVLPFRPHYLIIMAGSNDLRSDEFTTAEAIDNIKALTIKCIARGISPIFLTLPPVNAASIRRAFDEPTDPDWQRKFAEYNDFLRTLPHIDVASSFEAYSLDDGSLPEWMGLDGLHEDVIGKQLIAARVNADWDRAAAEADKIKLEIRP
ncbi:MAG: SGNH/GDSL hydrolase family protein [Selenomonadaceae bacterium]